MTEIEMKYLVLKMNDEIDLEYLKTKIDSIIASKYTKRGYNCDIYSKPLIPIKVKDISVDLVNAILRTKEK